MAQSLDLLRRFRHFNNVKDFRSKTFFDFSIVPTVPGMESVSPFESQPVQSNLLTIEQVRDLINSTRITPSIFTSTIRLLRRGDATGDAEFTPIANYLLTMILRSPGFEQAYGKFFSQFRGDQPRKAPTQEFKLSDWAHILAVYFLSRKLHTRITSPQMRPSYDQAFISHDLALEFAKAIPAIPLRDWIIVGAIRPLSLTIFSLINEQTFVSHRRALRSSNTLYSMSRERELFGVGHSVICGFLIQKLGLGADRAHELQMALDPSISEDSLAPPSLRLRTAKQWLDALMETGALPTRSFPAEFYPSKDNQKKILDFTQMIREERATQCWIDPRANITIEGINELEIIESEAPESVLLELARVETTSED